MKAASPLDKQQIILDLYHIGAVKLGEFQLKSGVTSPIYIDLRRIVSYPAMLQTVATALWECARPSRFDLLCGVPYTALPIATCMSLQNNIPMLMRRKEKKSYGTKQQIEGNFTPGQTCLLVEDVITSGASILETAHDLTEAGLVIHDIAVLIDREQGGKENLAQQHYTVHAVLTLTEILHGLLNSSVVSATEKVLLQQLANS